MSNENKTINNIQTSFGDRVVYISLFLSIKYCICKSSNLGVTNT